ICTDTGVPPTLIVVLLLMFQPSEPVENSLTSAISGTPLMTTSTGLACSWKCLRVMGQGFAMVSFLEKPMIPVAGHHIMSIERWRASPPSRTIVMCMPLRAFPRHTAMIPRTIRVNLNRLRRRERLLALAWGAACWLAIVLISLLAACLVDWLIDREIDT